MAGMQGRRVHAKPGEELKPHTFQPGDYGYWEQAGAWYARAPDDPHGVLTANLGGHNVIEHDDGTISVSPSILVSYNGADAKCSWHGYLNRGVWTSC